jgi:hypothetical protein
MTARIQLQQKEIPKGSDAIELTKTVLMDDDTTVKRKAKIGTVRQMEDFELLLRIIIEFKDIAQPGRLNLETEHDKISKFRECLQDPIRESYDLARSTLEDERNEADDEVTFDEIITAWLEEEIDADEYQDQLAYIKRVSKPNKLNDKSFSVKQFYQRVKIILKRMVYFPGAPDTFEEILSPQELNYTIVYAMPKPWQQKWKEKGTGSFSQAPIKDLIKHFQVLWEAESSNQGKLYDRIQDKQEDRGKRSRGNRGSGGGDRQEPKKKKRGDGETRKPSKASASEAKNLCKYHNGIHPWSECYGNKNGPNYKPDYRLPEIGKWKPRRDNDDAHHSHESQKTGKHKAQKAELPAQTIEPDNGESHWMDEIH